MRNAAVVLTLVLAVAGPAGAQSYPVPEMLLDTATDTVGTPIRYPAGAAHVSSYILTMVPGQETGWHRHDAPLYARVLEGEIAVDYGDKGRKTYAAGDTFMEAMGIWHNGRVVGNRPAKLLVVFMGADGTENTEMRK